jgi:hypothetical protein
MTELTQTWWIGSNGNLFLDFGGDRYCIARLAKGYSIARNGEEIAIAPCVAEAKLYVRRDQN